VQLATLNCEPEVQVLLAGAVLSIGSIFVKTVVELDAQKRFGYGPRYEFTQIGIFCKIPR